MEKTQLLKNTIYVKFMASCASLSFILPPQIILRPVLSQPSINSPPVSILYEHSNTHTFKKSRKIFAKTSFEKSLEKPLKNLWKDALDDKLFILYAKWGFGSHSLFHTYRPISIMKTTNKITILCLRGYDYEYVY